MLDGQLTWKCGVDFRKVNFLLDSFCFSDHPGCCGELNIHFVAVSALLVVEINHQEWRVGDHRLVVLVRHDHHALVQLDLLLEPGLGRDGGQEEKGEPGRHSLGDAHNALLSLHSALLR